MSAPFPLDILASPPVLRNPQFTGTPLLPEWVASLRPHQIAAVEEAVNHLSSGVKVVLLNAPTGSGKTLIGEMVRRVMAAQRIKAMYVCHGKDLQDQFARDFPYAKVLKGRSNYPTADHPELFGSSFQSLTAADCTKTREVLPACADCPIEGVDTDVHPHCLNCHPVSACPYERAKNSALGADVAVTNTSYFIAECNGPGFFSIQQRGEQTIDNRRPLVIIDECDTLESILMSAVEVVIPTRTQQNVGIVPPLRKTVEAGMKGDWEEWATTALAAAKFHLSQLPKSKTPTAIKKRLAAERLVAKLVRLDREMAEGNWIYDPRSDGTIVFKPVRVDSLARELIWPHGHQFLCMSATIVDPYEYASSLGLEDHEWAYVEVPCTFPAAHRPIHVVPVAEMTYANKAAATPEIAKAVVKIAHRHPKDRILVHTVSYDLTRALGDALRSAGEGGRVISYTNAAGREGALEAFKTSDNGIALAPSFDRGVDLPHDLCRVQVICKIPFPSLGDKQVSARLYSPGGQVWYLVQTIRTLIQMTGRAVRSETDWATTYILDQSFTSNIWKKGRHLLSGWWKESLQWDPGVLDAPPPGNLAGGG